MGDDLWGLTLSHHLPRMLMGLDGGLNEWFLWQQLHNLNVWEGEETWRRRPQQQGLLCNKQLCMCPWVHLSDPRGLLLNIIFFKVTGPKNYGIFVPDMQIFLKIQSGNETGVVSQILIKFWLWMVCLSPYTSHFSWQPEMFLKYCLILKTFWIATKTSYA